MPWLNFTSTPTPEAQARQTAHTLWRCMTEPHLVALWPALPAWNPASSPEQLFSLLGRWLAEQAQAAHHHLYELTRILETAQQEAAWLAQENHRLRQAPVALQLRQALQEQARLQAQETATALRLAVAQQTLAAAQKQVTALEATLAAQNRIIAQQQLRLHTLLGDPSDGATFEG